MWAEDLILNWRDNRLQFAAPRMHFLVGKPLELLHNAGQVNFDFQITLWSGNRTHVHQRIADRFLVSYDLWEERFKVAKTQAPRRTAEHLTAPAAEAWCLDQMTIDPSGLGGNELVWARLDIK